MFPKKARAGRMEIALQHCGKRDAENARGEAGEKVKGIDHDIGRVFANQVQIISERFPYLVFIRIKSGEHVVEMAVGATGCSFAVTGGADFGGVDNSFDSYGVSSFLQCMTFDSV